MLSVFSRLFRRTHRSERGQVMFLAAAFIAIMAGSAAMAIDVGSYMAHRRSLQNSVDAIALAASQNLPNGDSAHSAANEWAMKNNIDVNSMLVTVTQQGAGEPNPKVLIEIEVDHSLTFLRILGLSSAGIDVSATAIMTSPAGGSGVSPLSVSLDALSGATLGQEVVLKYDANDIFQGNTSPIRVDGPGSGNCGSTENYCSALQSGSTSVICAEGSDSTYCGGPYVVETEPGNKVGGTSTAINWRIDNTAPQCSEFEGTNGVFEDDPTTNEQGVYRLVPECNPFVNSLYSSHRVMIIPVIETLCNGACDVTVVTFALFFLERIGDDGCTGNDCAVVGRFVKVNQNVGLLAGTFDEDSYNRFVRLVAN